MKVIITKPIRLNVLSGVVEVTEQEFRRLQVFNAAEVIEERETPERTEKKVTKKAKK